MDVGLNVKKINHNSDEGQEELSGSEKGPAGAGAFVPVNDDDDDYDADNKPDKEQTGTTDDDLLPIYLRSTGPTDAGTFNLVADASKIYIWAHPDRNIRVNSNTAITLAANQVKKYYVEGRAAGNGTITLRRVADQSSAGQLKITVFKWQGALNVPQYGTYRYNVLGAPPGSKWIQSVNGSDPVPLNKPGTDVNIKWGAGQSVGKAVFMANANYVWDLGVNVVKVQVETPASAFVKGQPADGGLINDNNKPEVALLGTLKSIKASTAAAGDALTWKAKVTLTGAVDGKRGVKFMKVGFTQTAEIVALSAKYDGMGLRKHGAQDRKLMDGDEASTIPWFQTVPAAVLFNPQETDQLTPDRPAWNIKTITAADTPEGKFPVAADKRLPAQNLLTDVYLDYKFHLSVVAATSDTRNGGDKKFPIQAAVDWRWQASQTLGAPPGYLWNPANSTGITTVPNPAAWQVVTDGSEALVTATWGNIVIKEPSQWNRHWP